MRKEFKEIIAVIEALRQLADANRRSRVQILAAVHCGSRWRNVNKLKLTEGFTYLIRRVNKKTKVKGPVVAAVWNKQWDVLPETGSIEPTTCIYETIEVWI